MSRLRSGGLLLVLAATLTLGCRTAAVREGARPADAEPPFELSSLAGRSWVLAAWNEGEPAPATPPVSLRYAAGSFQGRSGCNRYTAPVEQRPGRGAIAVGAIAVTRMMCPEPIHGIERRFLAALADAKAIELRNGRLGLVTTGDDGRPATLIFTLDATAP